MRPYAIFPPCISSKPTMQHPSRAIHYNAIFMKSRLQWHLPMSQVLNTQRRKHLMNLININANSVPNTFLCLFSRCILNFHNFERQVQFVLYIHGFCIHKFCRPQIKNILKRLCFRVWGDDWVVENTGCSCRGPVFDFLYLHGIFMSSSRWSSVLFWPL